MKFENHENHNCRVLLENGEEFKVYANWLHNENLDYFKGWNCDAGVTRLFIDGDSNVYSGECKDSVLGNLDTGWQLLDQHSAVCKRDRCTGCTDDLTVKKYLK